MSGKEIHGKVEQTREAGDFWSALKLSYDAIKSYLEEKNYQGLSELHGSIALIYRHIYNQQEDKTDKTCLLLAAQSATTGIEIAKFHNLNSAVSLPTFNLAKVQEELGQYGEATETYQDAVDAFIATPPTNDNNRAGVLADMKIHLYTCAFKAGDQSALPKALDAITELENSNEKTVSKYNFVVWMSGGHMRIAEILKTTDLERAKTHLEEARKLIDENIQALPDLKLRKGQWEKLNASF
jgi:tetratricopeptide (TPR) repeat protein